MRSSRKSMRMRAVALFMAFLLLLAFAGCEKAEESAGLLSTKQVSSIEALYGQDRDAVLKALGLEESDVSQGDSGSWSINEPGPFEGKGFAQWLLFYDTGEFSGRRYGYNTADKNEALALIKDLLAKANELYGEPSTYPGETNRLSDDGFEKAFLSTKQAASHGGSEEWTVGEKTKFQLNVTLVEDGSATILINYVVLPPDR